MTCRIGSTEASDFARATSRRDSGDLRVLIRFSGSVAIDTETLIFYTLVEDSSGIGEGLFGRVLCLALIVVVYGQRLTVRF